MQVEDQGAGFNRYRIIPRVLIFIFNEDEVLLLKGAPGKKLWANRYNGIGGHVERGEDVLTAACRELAEETGLKAVRLDLCGTLIIDAGIEGGIGLFIFRGVVETRTVFDSVEGHLEWIRMDRFKGLPVVEDLPLLVPRVFNWKAGDPVFSAMSFYDETKALKVVIRD